MTFHYDKNGNRTSMFVHQCGDEYKSTDTTDIINDEIAVKEDNHKMFIYPNPNDGIFKIMIDDADDLIMLRIYNVNGVMIREKYLSECDVIDMTDNPSGIYLLRIIKGDSVYSEIVVKL